MLNRHALTLPQEMTHNILALLSATCPWWRRYSWNKPTSRCPYFTMLGCGCDAASGWALDALAALLCAQAVQRCRGGTGHLRC